MNIQRVTGRLLATALIAALTVAPPASAAPQAQQSSIDRLVAPIALYPDQLLAQMLLCATNPAKLSAFDEWLRSNQSQGTELQDAAMAAGFDPSFVALAVFPDVVSTMAADPKWTAALGEAFTADKSAVFASIQRLRSQAKSAGSLKTTPQQTVDSRTTSAGQEVIVIEPSNPQVVYVPQYNPQTVYTQPTTTTVVVQEDDDDDAAVAAGIIGFTAGIAIGAAVDNDYYYGGYGWGRGVYMYDDAWDDWYDNREDAREDWMDHREDAREDVLEHREDLSENRSERAGTAQEQRTERQQNRTENRPTTEQAQQAREQRAASGTTSSQAREQRAASGATTSASTASQARSSSGDRTTQRSGTKSDAFSGYSSGKSERAASQRGQKSRSGGGGRSGGGRRR
jgi:hypothetical protein